jgi:hypothetical protein
MAEIEYEVTCGAAPVQIEGHDGDVRFFFHARHDRWLFKATRDTSVDPADLPDSDPSCRSSAYENASYIPSVEAVRIIRECVIGYRRNGG